MIKYIIPLMAILLLVGCATSPLERRRASIRDCTVEFLQYEATVKNATRACISIYTKPRRKVKP